MLLRSDYPLRVPPWSTPRSGYTGDLDWIEIPVDTISQALDESWSITTTLPEDTTGWFMNGYANGPEGELVLSSDYQERITLGVEPAGGLELAHPAGVDFSVGRFN